MEAEITVAIKGKKADRAGTLAIVGTGDSTGSKAPPKLLRARARPHKLLSRFRRHQVKNLIIERDHCDPYASTIELFKLKAYL